MKSKIQKKLLKSNKEFTLDADSTVKLVYEKQQGAAKGHKPGKKAKKVIIHFVQV